MSSEKTFFKNYLDIPFVHICLISIALFMQWSMPVKIWYSLFFLIPSLLLVAYTILLRPPKAANVFAFPEFQISMAKKHFYGFFALFVLCPISFGLLSLIAWPFVLYILISSLFFLKLYRSGRNFKFESSLWFNLLFIYISYLALFLWPYISSHCYSFPFIIAKTIAYQQNFFMNGWFGFEVGSLSSSALRECQPILTRSGAIGLQGNLHNPVTFLMTTEQLQVLMFVFLLIGCVLRTLLITRKNKILNTCADFLSVLVCFYLYISVTWYDILGFDQSPLMYPRRLLSVICIALLWLLIRVSLQFFIDRLRKSSYNQLSTDSIAFKLPSFKKIFTVCMIPAILIVFVLLDDPGKIKTGNLIIDEYHSDWERSDLPMTPDIYGVKTVYNYSFMKSIFDKHYRSVIINEELISSNSLENCDVLILKTPTKPYSEPEIEAIVKFVENGGGLWLIGEHTNIFGINTYLNQIGKTWGLYFNSNAVLPVPGYYQDIVKVDNVPDYHRCGRKQHEVIYSNKYLNHPVISQNIPYATVLTSCSVSAPLFCEYISKPRGVYVDDAKFTGNTFFGNLKLDQEDYYGCVLQNVAMKVGKGRVAMWSDSTIFSNFSMCMSGVPKLALGYVDWLNRENTICSKMYNSILILLIVTSLFILFFYIKCTHDAAWVYIIVFNLILISIPIIDKVNAASYSLKDITKGFSTVGFDQQYSQMELPNKDHSHDNDPITYESFYVMMQRYKIMPISSDTFKETLKSDVAVLINPFDDLEKSDLELLKKAIDSGKNLILMINDSHRKDFVELVVSRANKVLSYLKISERFSVLEEVKHMDLYGNVFGKAILTDIRVGVSIDNINDKSKVLLDSSLNFPLIVKANFGKGSIILCSVGALFSNPSLGTPSSIPNFNQNVVIRSIEGILSTMLDIKTNKEERLYWSDILNNDAQQIN